MKAGRIGLLLFAIVCAGLGAYFNAKRQSDAIAVSAAATGIDPVARLLAQSLHRIKGKEESLGQYKGQPLLINFWATWCGPCVKEMPDLNAYQSTLKARHVTAIGIAVDSENSVAQFAEKFMISFPLYLAGDNGTQLLHALGNEAGGLPFTLLIDKAGVIKKTYLGPIPFDQLKKDLDLIAEAGP